MIGTSLSRRKARAFVPVLVLLSGIALAACGDDDDLVTVLPTPVVATFKDSTFNFSALHTFAMPDVVISLTAKTGTPQPVPHTYDTAILNQVRANFLARGYTQVDPRTTQPDFLVLVGASATTNYNAYVVDEDWWDDANFYSGYAWFAPGFSSAWTVGYPWYPFVGTTSYDRGSLFVTILPTLTINPLAHQITAEWAGVASGAVTENTSAASITALIDQMFQQSPYLTSGPVVTPH